MGAPTLMATVMLLVLLALLGPIASASADMYTIDSTGDAAEGGSGTACETASGQCTLRAAIETANNRPGLDQIAFDPAVFTGALSGTIRPTRALPAIVDPLEIVDGCPSSPPGVPSGTCAGLDASGLSTGLSVESAEVTIAGLAITGAIIGIDVTDSGDKFTARRDSIGADLAGEPEPNGTGIAIGSAYDVAIGGSRIVSDGNLFVGGLWGVTAGPEARSLTIEGNVVGGPSGPGSDLLEPPSQGAFAVDSSGLSYSDAAASMVENTIYLDGGIGIEATGKGAKILGNEIYGGDTGIQVDGENPSWFGAIDDNYLEYPGLYGIRIESARNRVRGNFVYGAEDAGIRVDSDSAEPPREVTVGGEAEVHGVYAEEEAEVIRKEIAAEEDENEIDDSGGPAIEIAGDETAFVDASRNFGALNTGPFIDLGGDGIGNQPTGPNRGTPAPTVLSATPDRVTGRTETEGGGSVTVFLKADSSPGEIEEFLAAAYLGEPGNIWSVELPESLAPGTEIAVGQGGYYGTSELSFATVEPGPADGESASENNEEVSGSSGPTGGTTSAGNRTRSKVTPPPQATPPAPQAPAVNITVGPKKTSESTTAKFKFTAEPAAGAKFECKLDKAKWAKCRSPKTYKKLKVGKHTFRVRAKAEGLTGAAAVYKFTVLP